MGTDDESGAAQEPFAATEVSVEAPGSRRDLGPRTTMLFGSKLDVDRRQADICNVLCHRDDDTLFVVDSGATPAFRDALHEAVESLRPFRHLVLINSHGHADHVANNDFVDEVAVETCRHYIARHEQDALADPAGYLRRTFEDVEPLLALPASPTEMAQDLMSLFAPFEPRAARAMAIESRHLHAMEVGGALWEGWRFGDDMWVLRQHGHTAGHLAFYIPSLRLLHLGDETNVCYPYWPDSIAWASFAGLRKALRMARTGAVDLLVDSHHATVFDSVGTRRLLASLVQDYQFLDTLVIDTLEKAAEGVDMSALEATLRASGVLDGVTDHPLVARMQILRKLQAMGAIPADVRGPETRFRLGR